jgi:hypothetical protein
LLAILLSTYSKAKAKDECVWYFINLVIDTTLCVLICTLFMRLIEYLAKKNKIKIFRSGLYYEKVLGKNGKTWIRLKVKMYFAQLGIWIGVVVMVCFIL